MSRPSGFTLLELLVVTALLTLLVALSWPSVRRSMSRAGHRRAVDEVMQLLEDARSRSIADGRPRLVQLDPQGRRFDIYEAVYDEVGAAYFSAQDGPRGGAATSEAISARRPQAPSLDEDYLDNLADEQDPSGDSLDPLPAGVGWRLSQTFQLAEGVWARVRQEPSPRTSERSMGRLPLNASGPAEQGVAIASPGSRDASSVDPNQPDLARTASTTRRLLFGVLGRTADLELEICNVSGRCTLVAVDGALGSIRQGETWQRQTADRSTEQPPTPGEGAIP